MFTVCPKCALTLVVTAADLRVAQGYVRCGRCSNVFNALARLAEDARRRRVTGVRIARRSRSRAAPPPQAACACGHRAAPHRLSGSRQRRPRRGGVDPTARSSSTPTRTDVSSVFVEQPPIRSGAPRPASSRRCSQESASGAGIRAAAQDAQAHDRRPVDDAVDAGVPRLAPPPTRCPSHGAALQPRRTAGAGTAVAGTSITGTSPSSPASATDFGGALVGAHAPVDSRDAAHRRKRFQRRGRPIRYRGRCRVLAATAQLRPQPPPARRATTTRIAAGAANVAGATSGASTTVRRRLHRQRLHAGSCTAAGSTVERSRATGRPQPRRRPARRHRRRPRRPRRRRTAPRAGPGHRARRRSLKRRMLVREPERGDDAERRGARSARRGGARSPAGLTMWSVGTAVLVLVLAGQIVNHYRHDLAATTRLQPAADRAVRRARRAAGAALGPARLRRAPARSLG